MLTFVTFKWQGPRGYRSTFGPETVLALKLMIERHYPHPHRFIAVTDDPTGLAGVDVVPLWSDCADIPSPIGHSYPSCYRRLKLFAPDASETFGERLVCMDLDTVITGDLTPLFTDEFDFRIWGESDFPHTTPYCGSLWMLKTGTRSQVWTAFDPATSPRKAFKAGCRGSDQGWISYILGRQEATWTRKDGVYSYRKHIAKSGNQLPPDARLVAFHGRHDPWQYDMQQVPWIRLHYPMQVPA